MSEDDTFTALRKPTFHDLVKHIEKLKEDHWTNKHISAWSDIFDEVNKHGWNAMEYMYALDALYPGMYKSTEIDTILNNYENGRRYI